MLPFEDLPAALKPPGLGYWPTFIDHSEQAELLEALASCPLAPFRFQGWTGKRQTASFGWHYDFEEARFAPAQPLPDWALAVRTRVAAATGVEADMLVQLLVTRYDSGAGIGWHRDRPVFDRVIGISLGAPATLRFRRRREGGFDRVTLPLAPGSAYRLSGEARNLWEHSIEPMADTRWSLTFRTLSAAGEAIERRIARRPSNG